MKRSRSAQRPVGRATVLGESHCEVSVFAHRLGDCINTSACFRLHTREYLPRHEVYLGVDQLLPSDYEEEEVHEHEVKKVIHDTVAYMTDKIYTEKESAPLRRDCFNADPLCSIWAAQGWCNSTEDLYEMQWLCAPACQVCHQLPYLRLCHMDYADPEYLTEDALEPGGLSLMFERIVREYPQYNPQVLSQPATDLFGDGEEGPWIVTLQSFLTDEECDFLVAQGHELGFEESWASTGEIDEYGEPIWATGTARTSRNTWCEDSCLEHPTTREILERMVNIAGVPEVNSEYLQLLKYEFGEQYEEHHDCLGCGRLLPGDRILTFFLYLSDVEDGGETRFTVPHGKPGDEFSGPPIDVKPKKGTALLWPNVLDTDLETKDDRTYHQALPVKKGRKYGANAWFRLRNFRDLEPDC